MNSFGAKLKSCRKDMSLSQKELGQKIGVAESTISLYESNKRFPDAETLQKISSLFNVSLDYLLGNAPCKKPVSPTDLPPLTPKDERDIARDLENMIESLDGSAAMGNAEGGEDRELLRASLETAMKIAKRTAKKKFTPKKYQK